MIIKKEVFRLECTCERCGYTWESKGTMTPRVCGRCKSPYWNVPKKLKGNPAEAVE